MRAYAHQRHRAAVQTQRSSQQHSARRQARQALARRKKTHLQMTNPASGNARGAYLPTAAALCAQAARWLAELQACDTSLGAGRCSAGRHLVALTCRQTSLTYGCRLPTYSALQPSDSAVVAMSPRLGRSPAAPLSCVCSRGATWQHARCASKSVPQTHAGFEKGPRQRALRQALLRAAGTADRCE